MQKKTFYHACKWLFLLYVTFGFQTLTATTYDRSLIYKDQNFIWCPQENATFSQQINNRIFSTEEETYQVPQTSSNNSNLICVPGMNNNVPITIEDTLALADGHMLSNILSKMEDLPNAFGIPKEESKKKRHGSNNSLVKKVAYKKEEDKDVFVEIALGSIGGNGCVFINYVRNNQRNRIIASITKEKNKPTSFKFLGGKIDDGCGNMTRFSHEKNINTLFKNPQKRSGLNAVGYTPAMRQRALVLPAANHHIITSNKSELQLCSKGNAKAQNIAGLEKQRNNVLNEEANDNMVHEQDHNNGANEPNDQNGISVVAPKVKKEDVGPSIDTLQTRLNRLKGNDNPSIDTYKQLKKQLSGLNSNENDDSEGNSNIASTSSSVNEEDDLSWLKNIIAIIVIVYWAQQIFYKPQSQVVAPSTL